MEKLLDKLHSVEQLREWDIPMLQQLAEELREFLIATVSKTGGHLAPNLGVVELTIALHRVFDTPRDKIIWDVGHQAYVHKIITDRKDRFHTLRTYGGISGFTKSEESPFDPFGAGHASTAISAALGIATARDLAGENFHVIAVVGDGALTGGMAFEGLNNAGVSRRDLIVVLNDNRMSISPNVGALANYLNKIIAAPFYNRVKNFLWLLTGRMAKGSKFIRGSVHRIEELIKALFVPSVLFERLGFRYFGPVDGHDLYRLIWLFGEIRKLHGPILVHVITQKGKGYKFAEENATKFHGLGAFCIETGEPKPKKHPTYSEVLGETLVELAKRNPKLVGITAAMADGTGLCALEKVFPDRVFDVGIAEQHAVTFSAGMARQGLRPVVCIYSTFLQRALDQIIHDVALQKLPVIFAIDRGGLVGEDGPTHHGSFDLSYLRMIPNLVIMSPKDENEFRNMLWTALEYSAGPIAIRYPRTETFGLPWNSEFKAIPIGKAEILHEGNQVAIFAIGDMVPLGLKVREKLQAKGISTAVINARFVKPLDIETLRNVTEKSRLVVTIENNTTVGGFGSGVIEALTELHRSIPVLRFGLPDRFVPHGNVEKLFHEIGLEPQHIASKILEQLP